MASVETQVPCSNIESITPANLLKFYLKPVYEAQYHFQVQERTLRLKMKEFNMHFKDFFAHIPSKNTKLSEDEIRKYEGKPIWEATYHLQVTESSLRSRVKALKLCLWRSSASVSASASASVSVSAYAYANPQDLLLSLLEGKGWNYGIVWDLEGSRLLWNSGYIVKEQPEMMPSNALSEELSLEDSLNDRRMNVFLKLSGLLSCENIRELNKSVTDIQWFYLFSMSESICVGESLAPKMLFCEAFLLSQTNSLFHSGWEHAQDAASFGLKTLILIPSENRQVVELGSKDIISETTLQDSIKRVESFFNPTASVPRRNLKRKAVAEDGEELEFEVLHNDTFAMFNLSKEGISFEKVQQSVAQSLTLQRGTFSLQVLYEGHGWMMFKNDCNLMEIIKYLGDRVKVRLRAQSNNMSMNG